MYYYVKLVGMFFAYGWISATKISNDTSFCPVTTTGFPTLNVMPIIVHVDIQDIFTIHFSWQNPLNIVENNISINVEIPDHFKIIQNNCTPELLPLNIISNNLRLSGKIYGILNCSIVVLVKDSIIPGHSYEIINNVLYENTSVVPSCYRFSRNKTIVEGVPLEIFVNASKDLQVLVMGDVFHLNVFLQVPEINHNLTVSVEYQGQHDILSSTNPTLGFPAGHINVFMSTNHFQAAGVKSVNKIFFNLGNFVSNYSKEVSMTSVHFVLPIQISNNSFDEYGLITVSAAGFSNVSKQIRIKGPIGIPELLLQRHVRMAGNTGEEIEFQTTIRHALGSHFDAFDVQLQDYFDGMMLWKIYSSPQGLVKYNSTFANGRRYINGYIEKLTVGVSATLVYVTRFDRSAIVDISNSVASVFWSSGQINSTLYGPVYSEPQCLKKNLKQQDIIIYNYGFILLGIVCGIILGIIIAVLLLLCTRTCPATKKYILHSNDVSDQSDIERKLSRIKSPPPYEDLDRSDGNEGNTENHHHKGFLSRIANSMRRKPTDEVTFDKNESLKEEFWRTDLINGDIDSTTSRINKIDEKNCVTLLKFSQSMFIHAWKISIKPTVEKLYSDGQINHEIKQKNCDDIVGVITHPNTPKNEDSNNLSEFLCNSSEYILQMYNKSFDLYNELLMSLKANISRQPFNRSGIDDPEVTKKQEEEQEAHDRKMQEYRKQFEDNFTSVFTKWLECCHYITGVALEEKLTDIAYGLSLTFYEQTYHLVYDWIKSTVIKKTDLLKRKRLLSLQMDSEFQEMFLHELEQVADYLEHAIIKVVNKKEKAFLLEHWEVKKKMHNHYDRLTTQVGKIDEEDDNANSNKTHEEKVNEAFELCFEYADVAKNTLFDSNENFLTIHENLISLLNQTLTVFFTRMQVHASDIYRTRIEIPELATDTESLHAEPIEMRQASDLNHLEVLISELKTTLHELISKLSYFEVEKKTYVKKERTGFKESYGGVIAKKKSEIDDVIKSSNILLKSTMQSFGPISWTNLEKLIEVAPKFCFEAVLKRYVQLDILLEVNFKEHYERIKDHEKDMMTNWDIAQKVSFLYEMNNVEIQEVYATSKEHLMSPYDGKGKPEQIKEIMRNHFSNLLHQTKEMQLQEQILSVSKTFIHDVLPKILSKNTIEKSDTEDKTMPNEVSKVCRNFMKNMKTITKKAEKNITEEGEIYMKKQLQDKLHQYILKCRVLSPNQNYKELQSLVAFDITEMTTHLFELGKQQQMIEDKTLILKEITEENLLLIHELWKSNQIPDKQIMQFFKDISLRVSPAEIEEISKHVFGNDRTISFQEIFNYLIMEQEEAQADDKDLTLPETENIARKRKKTSKKRLIDGNT